MTGWASRRASRPAFRVSTDRSDVELLLQREDIGRAGGACRVRQNHQRRAQRTGLRAGARGRSFGASGLEAASRGGGSSVFSLGRGVERTWLAEGTSFEVRAVLLPICAGTGSLLFVQVHADPYARTVLDGWLHSFRWIRDANAPACRRLDQVRRTIDRTCRRATPARRRRRTIDRTCRRATRHADGGGR